MADNSRRDAQMEKLRRYADLIARESGKAVRPYRADGFVNLMNKYGTSKDPSEQYRYVPELQVPDSLLTLFYEGNGLFAKIVDAPAEEAVKHGFTLDDVSDQALVDFYQEALEELDFEETAMTAIKWARLYGGSIAVMLINDGRGLEEPLDWSNIRSIDDIRVYDRSVVQPDYDSMFSYDPRDPFRTRGSRLGMPERYQVFSKYGTFTVHDSRCLVFRNGVLPEGASNSVYQFWGQPEYVRINKAIRDAEVAHGSAPKLLDRSVQAIYKMRDLSAELATEEGEDRLLKRLQIIDMARGMMNSIAIDSDGEEYDFIVVKDGKILCGLRDNTKHPGQVCGPGGHLKAGESYEQAAFREIEEEFGISPKELIPLGFGPREDDTGMTPAVFLCTDYNGEPYSRDGEIMAPVFRSMEELMEMSEGLYLPFAASLELLKNCIEPEDFSENPIDFPGKSVTIKYQGTTEDGGPGSGDFGHEGQPGQVGGSKRSLSPKEREKVVKRLVGQKTHDGITIKAVANHAFDRIGGRKMSLGRIDKMRNGGTVSPGNRPHTRCYDIEGSRMVVDTESGTVMTVMWRKAGRK